MKTLNQNQQINGWNLIRIFSLFIVSIHHYYYVRYYPIPPINPYTGFLWNDVVYLTATIFSFSGFTLFTLTMLLFGSREMTFKKIAQIACFLFFGSLIFNYTFSINGEISFEWDLYALIVLSLISTYLISKINSQLVLVFGFLGFTLLFIPWWDLDFLNNLSIFWRQILVGDCFNDEAEWPVLPWIGLAWLSYSLGYIWYLNGRNLHKWKNFEYLIWIPILGFFVTQFGVYAEVTEGEKFSCFVFRRTPEEFLAHLGIILLMIRLSLLPAVQSFTSHKIFLWCSAARLNKHFGLAYFITAVLASQYGSYLKVLSTTLPQSSNVILEGLGYLLFLPLTEVLLRWLVPFLFKARSSNQLKNLSVIFLLIGFLFSCEKKENVNDQPKNDNNTVVEARNSYNSSTALVSKDLPIPNVVDQNAKLNLKITKIPTSVKVGEVFEIKIQILNERGEVMQNFKSPVVLDFGELSVMKLEPGATNLQMPINGEVSFSGLYLNKAGDFYFNVTTEKIQKIGGPIKVSPETNKIIYIEYDGVKYKTEYQPPNKYTLIDAASEGESFVIERSAKEVVYNGVLMQINRDSQGNLQFVKVGKLDVNKMNSESKANTLIKKTNEKSKR